MTMRSYPVHEERHTGDSGCTPRRRGLTWIACVLWGVSVATLGAASPAASPLQDASAKQGSKDQDPKQDQKSDKRPERKLLPLPVYPARRLSGQTITVDGSLHEWPTSLPAILLSDMRQLSGTAHGAFRGPSDLSARGAAMWDDERLYLFFLIQDDWGRPFNTQLRLPSRLLQPPADSIVLSFDPKRDTRSFGPDEGRADDREYWCGMTSSGGTLLVEWQRFKALASRPVGASARMLYDPQKKMFTVEMALPWSEIAADFKPKIGAAMDMQITIDDFDAPTDTLPQTRIGWTFGSSPTLNPAIYGTLLLVEKDWKERLNPDAPPLPRSPHPKLPDETFWIRLHRDLLAIAPRPGLEGLAGRRGELLRALDDRLAIYPVLDTQEMYRLLHREMPRELSGYLRSGPPLFQDRAMVEMLRALEQDRTPSKREIWALPGRGFFYRSEAGQILISPSALHAHKLLPIVDGVLFAASQDPMQRQDPLVVRARQNKIPFLAHMSFHVPTRGALDVGDLVKPGETRKLGEDIEVRMLADQDARGRVPPSMGYQLTDSSGFVVVAPALSARPQHVKLPESKTDGRIDLLILDPDHELADEFVTRFKPRWTVLEGFLDLRRSVGDELPRSHRLSEVKSVIERFEKLGTRVWLLAPGQRLVLESD